MNGRRPPVRRSPVQRPPVQRPTARRPTGIDLPEALTRLLDAPRSAIWPTPDDPARPRLGPQRPREPSRVVLGVWVWAILYNLVGFAILAALWRTML